jgi:protein O-mannosyl-transferase
MAQPQKPTLKAPVLPPLSQTFKYFSFLNQKIAMIVIGIVGFVFYITSINGEYALDDGIIIHQNDHVIKGVRGIKDILTKDAYESFYRRMCATDQLAGGRYRPLSVVSFAIEQEFIGSYRTGLYMKVADENKNGILDKGLVNYISPCGRPETNYEYNDFVDQNGDGMAQGNECYSCWDLNKNFKNDVDEDLNVDGIFNEIDCQVYGANVRHFNNIWTYALGCMFLYLVFSRYFFRTNQDFAFLAALLFTMHPIHSEAIANVKSRDEIFSLIFISLTFLYTFKYIETKKNKELFWACIMFLLALLSKEYAIMLLFLVPLSVYTFTENDFEVKSFFQTKEFKSVLYVGLAFVFCAVMMLYLKRNFDMHAPPGAKPIKSFWLFPFIFVGVGIFLMGANKRNNFHKLMSWFYFVMLFYLAMRLLAVKLKPGVPDTEILNNPYLLADGEERFATKGYVLLKYLILQVFPHPLSSDYSYATIQYRKLSSWDFLISIVLHVALVVYAIKFTLKKHVLGFAMMTYILFALMIGNVLMDIGATMGERLIFHSNIGFCIAAAYLILKGFDALANVKINVRRTALISLTLVITFLFGCKTWERNFDWKNDVTLFLKDVRTMPHSVLVLGNAGARWVDLADTKEVTGVNIPGQDSTRFNDYNGTLVITDEEVKQGGYANKREAALYKGIGFLKHAIELHPRYVNGYLNLGLANFKLRKDFEALYYWKNAERLYPNNPYLRSYYQVYATDLKNRGAMAFNRGRMDSAAMHYNKWTILTPNDHEAWYNLGGAYFNSGRYALAKKAWDRSLQINPNYAEVKKVLPMITPQMLGQAPATVAAPPQPVTR